jgi:disulfide bond formation protein DsbB
MTFHFPMRYASIRQRALLGLLVSIVPVVAAISFQHFDHLVPCHLCLFQRACYALSALGFLAALVHAPRSLFARLSYAAIASLGAIAGLVFAGRQVWLQHLPAGEAPSCGASLDMMMEMLPFRDVLSRVMKGTGECAMVDWTLAGFSMAQWSVLCLCMVLLCSFWLALPGGLRPVGE